MEFAAIGRKDDFLAAGSRDPVHLGVIENLRACRHGAIEQSLMIESRMHAPELGQNCAAMIKVRGELAMQLAFRHHLEGLAQMLLLECQHPGNLVVVMGAIGHDEPAAAAEAAFDLLVPDQPHHIVEGGLQFTKDPDGIVRSPRRQEFRKAVFERAADKAGVASAGTLARGVFFQHHHTAPGSCQSECCRKTGVAGAHDSNVDAGGQGSPRRLRPGRGIPPIGLGLEPGCEDVSRGVVHFQRYPPIDMPPFTRNT